MHKTKIKYCTRNHVVDSYSEISSCVICYLHCIKYEYSTDDRCLALFSIKPFNGIDLIANMQHNAATRLHTILGHIAPSVSNMATNHSSAHIEQSATHNTEKQTTISSHVLDTQSGKPASGLRLKLHIKDQQGN